MTRKLLMMLIAALPFVCKAQLTLNAQLPPGGLVKKEQLWNLVLSNNKDEVIVASITMYLKDAVSGQVVLSASSSQLQLTKGSRIITTRDVEPVIYNTNGPGMNSSFIPLGSYIACYQVFEQRAGEAPSNEDCININIDPLSPPLLNTPLDKSEVETAYPQFTWIPPGPVEMFSSLSYDIIVTEVSEGQSPAEAIQYNSPVYSKTMLTQPYDVYPSSFSKLDTGKTYAWQVIARNDFNYAAKTEVWSFTVKKKENPYDIVSLTPYIRFRTAGPEKGIAPDGVLKIAYNNKTPDTKIKIEILESPEGKTDKNRQVPAFDVKLIRGENNIEYDLHKIMKPEEGKVYTAKLVNSHHEVWYVQFVIKNYK